ncbi:GrpB family protein [Larkinella insperata]|uniref:GrpB family protein n=1 Tax=Larkinella insperata TaxID=332158 RepID=A0ABW3QDY2_9BACT|nr:GrpB family protein [Larkinella insperata]
MHPLHQPFQLVDESQTRAAFVGEMPPLTDRVEVVDYQPQWPALFQQEATRIRRLLGPVVLGLEHVGSTSVPGLAAKPIIDMDLMVADSADEASYLPPLERAGYRLLIREPDWQQHRMLKGPATDINLHVWTLGSIEAQRHVVFRDWLRTHPEDRERYGQLKKEVARQPFTYIYEYNNAKASLIYEIYERAFSGQ